ncbi:PREDICTED: thyroid adenoma-associated protein homolog isoform X2 [Camelina sativa]|uniref:Thyroid adenoma-associated protein homolog isoform X2 n=1 Tax=Camelina sativa TaxID=90675 RepID=A0ABM0ZI60_CAMSA|nr:PREDICTED: thyroid adenoma-associated protein homolog isoform X2 [Camelina sativa]
MSAKWRALQHRHRYTYSAVLFPSSFTASLSQSSLFQSCPKFYSNIEELVSLNSIYAQVNHAKKIVASFGEVLAKTNENEGGEREAVFVREAIRFYLEVLFMENSLPLHKTLVSALAKTSKFHSVISSCFKELCDDYGGLEDGGNRFCVSRVALSVMGMPKLGYLVDIIEDCALLVGHDIVSGLNGIILDTEACDRPPPTVMEQCQEALSCSYYLFQRFPLKFKGLAGEDASFMEGVLAVQLSILKSSAFSRDCYVAAGVSFCAALQVCLKDEELGMFIAQGIFCWSSVVGLTDIVSKIPFAGDICSEICSFSSLSRLCLIRGILTTVSRGILVSSFAQLSNSDCDHRTILYDGILLELCDLCENPIDSHLNFHALTVMQICLQQIKTSMLTDLSEDYDRMPDSMTARVLRIIWNNLEDPLSQTVKQVHLMFDLLLDIQTTVHQTDDKVGIRESLLKIVNYLLRLGSRCKGRYVPLASLTRRLGAKTLMDMSPNLLFEMANAYIDDDVCYAVTSFLKCFLEMLRDESWGSEGVDQGYARYREHCLPPFLYGLASGMSKLRSNLNTYAVQVLLELDVDSIFLLLAYISIGPSEEETKLNYTELSNMSMELTVEQKVVVLVSLLKVCRTLAFLEGDIEQKRSTDAFAIVQIKGVELKVPIEWLKMALTHVDESVRVDAAETLFLNPKNARLPSPLELYLMKEAVPLNMRSSSTGFQMKWTSLFRKFFSRVRTSLEKQYKHGSLQPLKSDENAVLRAESLFKFMRWLSSFLFLSCYPSAPYRRKIMATELLQIMIEVWPVVASKDPTSHQGHLYPYCDIVTSHDSTLLLVGSIVDSWDRLRENSFRILLHYPTPFTGVSSEDMVQNIIPWAKHLVCSPRVRESDAGALTLRLIFRKYVLDLGWIVKVSTNVFCCERECESINGLYQNSKPKYPVIEYIKSLIHWLDVSVMEGERDLSEACKNSFVHGVLLALRYTFEELDWNSNAGLSMSEMRKELEKLLKLVTRITTLALWVVSADALSLPEDMDDIIEDDGFLSNVQDDAAAVLSEEHKSTFPKPVHETIQSEQVVMVGCWLAMKEVSLLLGTIIRKIPLPTCSLRPLENGDSASAAPSDSVIENSELLLDLKQLEKIGDHFLEVLLKMKHNGAIDKTRARFTALCHRLLCSNDPRLCKLTESWMEQLMERTVARGQTVDDVLRRSAGIPAAFIALFLSEPEGSPKKLLPQALRWLISLAEKPLLDPMEQKGSKHMVEEVNSSDMHSSENLSKVRDEGVVPTVHAFNVLKAAFNDTNLSTDTSGFSAEAMIVSIRSFSSQYWEVRNSATLAYTALVRRMIGFLNVQKRVSTRRALTGLEFFHRYPLLHPFIYSELKTATDLLDTSGPSDSNLVNLVHPSLWPILILLSRLKPSPIASETGDDLDPFVFMPFIMKCSTQRNLRVRVLASRALVGLVSNEKLQSVLLQIASTLPSNVAQGGSFNYLHGILLQLGNLLDTNCRDLADDSKKDQIIGKLINVLSKCTWMASPLTCPCPILCTSFLRVLDHMRVIERASSESKNLRDIYKLHLDLSTNCLDTDASYGFSYYDPSIADVREQAAVSYFGCIFQPSDEAAEVFQITQRPNLLRLQKVPEASDYPDLNERFLRCLSDQSYEVRLATLKWLLQFLKSEDSSFSESSSIWNWAKNSLQVVLLELLDNEKNHKCENYILKILFQWNLLMFKKSSKGESVEGIYVGSLNYDLVLHLWGRLTSLYESTRRAKIRGTLMCCLAICVKHLTGLFFHKNDSEKEEESRRGCVIDCVSYFVNMIKEKSLSSEQVNVRHASAEAIIASGILEQAKIVGPLVLNHQIPSENIPSTFQNACNVYAYQILDMWFTCIKLLEDEDDIIRSKLATDVQKCFFTAMEVPTQVDKVLELSFNHLSSVFGHWNEYSQYLSKWVFNTADYSPPPKGGSDLVRRVFDKEIDNHHEEKLLILQFGCYHLQKLPMSDFPLAQLLDWRSKFHNQLLSFAKDHISKQRESWLGGVGNHKDVFLPLYGNLLGLYVFSNCIIRFSTDSNDKKALCSDMIELGGALKPFLRNPLVCNMFRVVVRLHQNLLDDSLDDSLVDLATVLSGEIWEGFDPYFLLTDGEIKVESFVSVERSNGVACSPQRP